MHWHYVPPPMHTHNTPLYLGNQRLVILLQLDVLDTEIEFICIQSNKLASYYGTQTYLERIVITLLPAFHTDASQLLCISGIPTRISSRMQAYKQRRKYI